MELDLNEPDTALDAMKKRYDALISGSSEDIFQSFNPIQDESESETDENYLDIRNGVPQPRLTSRSMGNFQSLHVAGSEFPRSSNSNKRRRREEHVESEAAEEDHREIYVSPHRQHLYRQSRRN